MKNFSFQLYLFPFQYKTRHSDRAKGCPTGVFSTTDRIRYSPPPYAHTSKSVSHLIEARTRNLPNKMEKHLKQESHPKGPTSNQPRGPT